MGDVVSQQTPSVLMILLAVLLPPLAVMLRVGLGKHFWLSLFLTIFFWVPGVIHAMIIVMQK